MSSLTFTLIQSDLHWENKPANLQMLEKKIMGIEKKTEVVLLPEMFTTGFSMSPQQLAEDMNGDAIAWMRRISAEKKIILAGSLMVKNNDQYLNRLVWMLPNGQMGWYDKRHLFRYANEDEYFSPGNKRLIASVKGWRINLLICYDLRFPVWSRQSYSENEDQGLEYDVLIYVANWPAKRSHMWTTLLQARAIENQCYTIGVNRVGTDGNGIYYSGDSMLVSPLGEVLYHAVNEEDIHTFTLQKDELEMVRKKMPFWKDADPFIIMKD